MDYSIGDIVVYNPNIEGLAPANERMLDWGVVLEVTDTHIATYLGPFKNLIRKESVSHAPYSRKAMKIIMDKSIKAIRGAIEAREARRIMLFKTDISIAFNSPCQIIQDFLTSNRRSSYKLRS